MTYRLKKSEEKSGDTSDVLDFPWSTDQYTRALADIKQHSLSPTWLKNTLKKAITCILSSYETASTSLPSIVLKEIVESYQKENMRYCKLTATELSWAKLCPMMKYQILENCGQLNYTTPLYVNHLKPIHDRISEMVINSLREALKNKLLVDKVEPEFTLSYVRDKVFVIRGKPDYFAIIKTKKDYVSLIAEVTISDTVRHLEGEMLFYMASAIYYTSHPVIGLIIYNKGIRWLKYSNFPRKIRSLFTTPKNPEEAAERIYNKIKWACSNCDLMNTCPVYSIHR
nr:hypothetical protein [Acidianus infernus]